MGYRRICVNPREKRLSGEFRFDETPEPRVFAGAGRWQISVFAVRRNPNRKTETDYEDSLRVDTAFEADLAAAEYGQN